MKNQFKILLICLIFGTSFLKSCTEKEITNVADKSPFTDFSNFPDSPFLNLDFGLTINKNISLLNENNFLIDAGHIYIKSSDSTSVILAENDNLSEFKIYLKSDFYLENSEALFNELSEKSAKTIGTYQFAEMTFRTTNNSYNLTYFTTDNSIRISYQLIIPHH